MAAGTGFVTTSGQLTSVSVGTNIYSLEAFGNGVNASTVQFFYGNNASGAALAAFSFPASAAGLTPQSIVFKHPISAAGGVFVQFTGTGGTGLASYDVGE